MQNKNERVGDNADFAKAKSEVSDRLDVETQSANEALHNARDEAVRRGGEYVSQARQALSETAQDTQNDIGSSLATFGGALRAASEHLAGNDQNAASKFVSEAASGLENLSSSLRNKPFGQVLEEVQTYGRQNPGTLLAGSLLAGLALGRFIKASPPEGQGKAGGGGQPNARTTGSADSANASWGTDGGIPGRAAELKK
jgi:hypothetical protein